MKILKKILIVIGAIILLLFIWGMIEPYTISIEEQPAVIPNLPEEWEGEEIAVVADFQIGMWMDNDLVLSRVVDKIIDREPKAVLILGDFVYHANKDHEVQMKTVIDYLRPLTENGLKVYAVLGNHDYAMDKKDAPINWDTADRVVSMLEEIDIEVLHNESVALSLIDGNVDSESNEDNPLYIAGIGSHWANEDDVEKALSSFPAHAPRFIMMHNPATFTKFQPNTAPVAVAGHTHGGQFRLPFSPKYSYMDLSSEEEARVDGWIEQEFGDNLNSLYVNRGIGLSLVPMRINCPPEITVFTLQKE